MWLQPCSFHKGANDSILRWMMGNFGNSRCCKMRYCCSFLVLCRVSDETHKGKGKGKRKVAPLYTMKAYGGGPGGITPRRNSRIQGVRSWRATKIWNVTPDACGSLFHLSPQNFWKICAPLASRILNLDNWRGDWLGGWVGVTASLEILKKRKCLSLAGWEPQNVPPVPQLPCQLSSRDTVRR